MYRSDQFLLLLYVTNVLQPVTVHKLRAHYASVVSHARTRPGEREEGFNSVLTSLIRKGLIRRKAKLYSVSPEGLHRLGALGLGRLRDKNRLLLLNKLL